MKGIKYYSFIESSGYGLAAISYLNALLDLGCPLHWIPLLCTERGYQPWYQLANAKHKIRKILEQCLSEGERFERLFACLEPIDNYQCIFMHVVPEYWPHLKEDGKSHVGYTVWETSDLPKHFPSLINQVDRVLVPSFFNRPIFRRSGVDIPVYVVPHILNKVSSQADTAIDELRMKLEVPIGNTVFYSINTWTARKALWDLVHDYLAAFTIDDPVSLVIKTSRRGPSNEADPNQHDTTLIISEIATRFAKPAHIKVINYKLANDEITALHQLGDCFVSTSHSEGWGLGMFEAAGAGNPVIATGWGGHLDFLPEALAYLSDYKLIQVIDGRGGSSYGPEQRWAKADSQSVSEHLTSVYANPEIARQKAELLAKNLHKKYSSDQIGAELYQAIYPTRIPKLFHFIFGLREQTEPFHLAYYLCLKSCLEVNKPSGIHFYYHYQPYGEYWELIKPHLTLIEVELESFVQQSNAYQDHQEGHFIQAAKLDYAHQADFIRLKKLIEYGGVYADMDTLFVNPIPDELYQHPFVIGREQNLTDPLTKQEMPSLCNALLMSEPNSEFAKEWLKASYLSFDGTWSAHSCQQAATLASELPHKVYVAPQRYFFKHMWTKQGISTLFEGLDDDFDNVFSMHMWNHLWWEQSRIDFSSFHKDLITERHVMTADTTYNVIARQFIPHKSCSLAADGSTKSSSNAEATQKLKKSPSSILVPELVAGWVLYPEADSSRFTHLQLGKSFDTNETTNLILEQCDGIKSVETIIQSLSECFPDDVERIAHDVKTTLRHLALNGAIQFKKIAAPAAITKYSAPPALSKQYKLCIGMATYDDYDGVYFSVQAIRMYHSEVLDHIEFVVLDNNPSGVCSNALRVLGDAMPNYRYIEGDNFQGTWSRFSLINQTNAPYVMCIDSHVMILPGAIKQLLDYIDEHPNTPDLLQGPLVGDDLLSLSSHFTPGWGAGMYGKWATDSRAADIDNPGFDIPMQGLGLFVFHRDSWPKINPRFKGFGGEEGYVHEKVRRAGGRTLCLPFLRWIHRFNRPMGTHYALSWEDRIRNYMIASHELDVDNGEMIDHFNTHIGAAETTTIVAKIEAEINNPFYFFDAIYCINLDSEPAKWETAMAQFDQLEIAHRVQRFSAVETFENHPVGCALSHRAIIQDASISRFKNVLVLQDDVIFDAATLSHLANSLLEAKGLSWDILYLGGHGWDSHYSFASGSKYLREISNDGAGPTGTHAIVYNDSSYSKLLEEFPSTIPAITDSVNHRFSTLDQRLAAATSLKKLIAEPRVAGHSLPVSNQ
jgi:glycosyltransferase involved in cell wall biosynthesis